MKKLTGIFLGFAIMVSLVAYGCHASGSLGTNSTQNQTPPAAVR
jgi:hypothetical protein